MAQTTPPTVDPLPPAPNTSSPSTFAVVMDAFLAALLVLRTQLVALGANIYANCVDAYNSAVASDASATIAATQAAAAVSGVNAAVWVSGTTYTDGQARYSPIDRRTYRRVGGGAGTTDPSADAVNWILISSIIVATTAEVKSGASAVKAVSPAALLASLGVSTSFQSADQTITSSGALTIAHGMGRAPTLVFGFMKCVAAESNYSIGDIVPVPIGISPLTTNSPGVAITFDATNIYARYGSGSGGGNGVFTFPDKTSGSPANLTSANWKFFLRVLA